VPKRRENTYSIGAIKPPFEGRSATAADFAAAKARFERFCEYWRTQYVHADNFVLKVRSGALPIDDPAVLVELFRRFGRFHMQQEQVASQATIDIVSCMVQRDLPEDLAKLLFRQIWQTGADLGRNEILQKRAAAEAEQKSPARVARPLAARPVQAATAAGKPIPVRPTEADHERYVEACMLDTGDEDLDVSATRVRVKSDHKVDLSEEFIRQATRKIKQRRAEEAARKAAEAELAELRRERLALAARRQEAIAREAAELQRACELLSRPAQQPPEPTPSPVPKPEPEPQLEPAPDPEPVPEAANPEPQGNGHQENGHAGSANGHAGNGNGHAPLPQFSTEFDVLEHLVSTGEVQGTDPENLKRVRDELDRQGFDWNNKNWTRTDRTLASRIEMLLA
jgi:hypothetical protein